MMLSYTNSLVQPHRRKTREVHVGDVVIGGNRPVVIQSMTTTSTRDTEATVDQIGRLVDAGCQIVRVTTPTMADVENLPNIREEMKRRELRVPLVADVHFLPQIAVEACRWVEKVRVNPGNFADRKKFELREYSDAQYDEEIERVRAAFLPVLRRAKEYGIALRIGTNHGSLSDRIMNRFGDTPLGMVESAIEFVRFAQDEGFHDLVLSMKSSNTQVMIQAYRLLVARMNDLGMDYPLHLGVTEAGDGEDGRIKSAVGIGSLLADGLGDTIRVSLTEDPVHEIPVAELIARRYTRPETAHSSEELHPSWNPFAYVRRVSLEMKGSLSMGGGAPVRVRTRVPSEPEIERALLQTEIKPPLEAVSIDDRSIFAMPPTTKSTEGPAVVLRVDGATPGDVVLRELYFDALSVPPSKGWADPIYAEKLEKVLAGRAVWFRVRNSEELESAVHLLAGWSEKTPFALEVEGHELIALGRRATVALSARSLRTPIHVRYVAPAEETKTETLIRASVEIGSLLCDGIGDSVEIVAKQETLFSHRLAYNILQACRLRMSKTEYIACPSCGRTLFDLEEVTAKIRSKTSHLAGVKIAIMGCIVNGPGEMADADFGYVGSGPGHVNLYVGKECVERHVPQAGATDTLIDLIKKHGRWVEPA